LFKGKIVQWLLDENNLQRLYSKFSIKSIPQLKEKLVSQEPFDSLYKYELFILAEILGCNISVENQYDEIILEYSNKSKDTIIIKYEIYNNIITKFYAIYLI